MRKMSEEDKFALIDVLELSNNLISAANDCLEDEDIESALAIMSEEYDRLSNVMNRFLEN